MPCCNHCNYKWKAKDIWLLSLSKKGKECPNCKTRQFILLKRKEPLIGLGYLSGIVAILFLVFFPFLARLSDNDETML
jgi:hypothetical protein